MQRKLQLNQNSRIKKQLNKLSLEIKFSEINSTWYQKTQRKMIPTNERTSKICFGNQQQCRKVKDDQNDQQLQRQILQDKIQYIEHKIDKQIIMMQKQKELYKNRIEQMSNNQQIRQESMREFRLRREIKIKNMKRQLALFMKLDKQNIHEIFLMLQEQFERELTQLITKMRKDKKEWKLTVKGILEKYQGKSIQHNDKQQTDIKMINRGQQKGQQQSQQQSILSISQLKQQIITIAKTHYEQSTNYNKKLITIIQQFNNSLQQITAKYQQNINSIKQQIKLLQSNINQQLLNEQLQYQQHRQQLLLIFQQHYDHLQNHLLNNKLNNNKQQNTHKPISLLSIHTQYEKLPSS